MWQMPGGQVGTLLWLCVRWGRDKAALGEEKNIYISVRSKCPSLPALPKNGQLRKKCLCTVGNW